MITAEGIELRAGSRILLENATFRVAPGDRVGLVGRNGAGKTTLTKVLAGDGIPAAGRVVTSGEVGYLPQDPRTGDLHGRYDRARVRERAHGGADSGPVHAHSRRTCAYVPTRRPSLLSPLRAHEPIERHRPALPASVWTDGRHGA